MSTKRVASSFSWMTSKRTHPGSSMLAAALARLAARNASTDSGQKCQAPLRLIALVKNQDIAKRILTAMHLPTEVPELHPARPPPGCDREGQDAEEWVN